MPAVGVYIYCFGSRPRTIGLPASGDWIGKARCQRRRREPRWPTARRQLWVRSSKRLRDMDIRHCDDLMRVRPEGGTGKQTPTARSAVVARMDRPPFDPRSPDSAPADNGLSPRRQARLHRGAVEGRKRVVTAQAGVSSRFAFADKRHYVNLSRRFHLVNHRARRASASFIARNSLI
jgi:hypothetical protein